MLTYFILYLARAIGEFTVEVTADSVYLRRSQTNRETREI